MFITTAKDFCKNIHFIVECTNHVYLSAIFIYLFFSILIIWLNSITACEKKVYTHSVDHFAAIGEISLTT